MKLRLRDDYLDTLHKWRQMLETSGSNCMAFSWGEIFKPDNTVAFPDLEIGQAFWSKIEDPHILYRVKLDDYTYVERYNNGQDKICKTTPCDQWIVTPGKVIDGKFVPDKEGE